MKTKLIIRILVAAVLILAGAYVWFQFRAQESPEVGYESPTMPEAAAESEAQDADKEPVCENQSRIFKQSDIDSGYLILVNKTHGLDRDYKPDDLSDIKYYAADRGAEGRFMRAAAADAFNSLAEEADGQGMEIVVTTAYRSYGFQATLYNNYVANDGQAAADRYSAKPGYSEHQTGLAADVSSASVNYRLTRDFADTEEGRWLSGNAHLFGFIIRYPDGKEDITGYLYEPWHLRYVGTKAAEYIHSHEITLEEYIQLLEMEE